jgi:hypothetical protein
MLSLAVGPRVSHLNILDLYGIAFTELPKLMQVEIGSQVCDDSVGEAKSVQDVTDEANHSIYRDLCNWLVLNPVRELVDGYQHMSKTS